LLSINIDQHAPVFFANAPVVAQWTAFALKAQALDEPDRVTYRLP